MSIRSIGESGVYASQKPLQTSQTQGKYINVKIEEWKKGSKGNTCIWNALRNAGYTNEEIVKNKLIDRVAKDNNIKDPNIVHPGQVVRIPRKEAEAIAAGALKPSETKEITGEKADVSSKPISDTIKDKQSKEVASNPSKSAQIVEEQSKKASSLTGKKEEEEPQGSDAAKKAKKGYTVAYGTANIAKKAGLIEEGSKMGKVIEANKFVKTAIDLASLDGRGLIKDTGKILGDIGKKATKEGGEVLAKEGAEVAAKDGAKLLAKEGAEVAAKDGAKLLAKEGAKIGGKALGRMVPGINIGVNAAATAIDAKKAYDTIKDPKASFWDKVVSVAHVGTDLVGLAGSVVETAADATGVGAIVGEPIGKVCNIISIAGDVGTAGYELLKK